MFTRLPRKAYASIRDHAAIAISLVALFVALGGTAYAVNTVRSGDIVDGQVKTVDLANGAVTGAKTTGFRNETLSSSEKTSNCAFPNIWSECAALSVFVPEGHLYVVTVWSSVSADPGTTTMHALYCAAKTGPTCMIGGPDYATFWARGVGSASQS